MEPQYYPTWRYHNRDGARLFANKAEYEAAGEGWEDTPDKFLNKTGIAPAIIQEPVPASEPVAEQVSEPEQVQTQTDTAPVPVIIEVPLTADSIRQKAKELGIAHWAQKSISRLQDEITQKVQS